jgi:hypothetical protein
MKCSAHSSVFACLLLTLSLSVLGCSASFDLPDTTSTTPLGQGTGDIQGYVHGGRQPIAGASIYLYGASNTGYSRNASTPPAPISLLGNVVSHLSPTGVCSASVVAPLYFDGANCYYLTGGTSGNTVDPIGGFNLSGLYKCNVSSPNAATGTLPGQQVWIYSNGGIPGVVGSGNGSTNVQAGLTAALGTCNASTNNFSTYSFIYVNEVSTVAFAYAVAGFASDARHVSAPATNYTGSSTNSPGLTNAFNNAALLYDIFGGSDPGDHGARHFTPNVSGTNLPAEGNGTNPFYMINSVADVIASCINTANPTPEASSQCEELFDDVYGSANLGTNPSDTASAAIYIAQHPAPPGLSASVTNLMSINDGTSPWSPNYTTSGAPAIPLDLTAGISYTGVNTPVGVAIDGKGDAYVTSSGGTISELSPKGIVSGTSAGLGTSISYLTIDSTAAGNIWTPSSSNDNVYELTSALALKVTYVATNGTVNLSANPHQITADGSGEVYIADASNSLVWHITKAGVVGDFDDHTAAKLTCTVGVTGIAYDNHLSNYIWTAGDGTTDNVCRLSGATSSGVQALLPSAPSYVAVDGTGDGWVTAGGINEIYELNASNDVLGPFGGGGLETPSFITTDGGGDTWIVNNSGQTSGQTTPTKNPSVSEFDTNGAPISPGTTGNRSGYQYNLLSEPSGIAIDQSGDVWVTNQAGSTFGNTIVELIGAAFPTAAPISVAGPGKLP